MKSIYTLILTSLFFVACQNSESYLLEGDAKGYADGTQILIQSYSFSENFSKIIDTLIVENEKFQGTYPVVKRPSLYILKVENERTSLVYFPENTNLKATIDKDSLQNWKIVGGKQNDAKSKYDKEIIKYNLERQELMEQYQRASANNDQEAVDFIRLKDVDLSNKETAFRKDFFKKQPKSLFAVMLLDQMVRQKEITGTEAYNYLDEIKGDLANVGLTQRLKAQVETLRKAEIGVKAPEFSGPTPDGEILALSDVLGKYTIIDFWASWCQPCRKENPNVVAVYEKYHDKGLNIISVSLDRENERDKWIKAIQDDKMDWYHISNLQFWQDPILQDYNVKQIPATFLLDENGIIIDKDLRGQALHAKMASLFEGK